ncbi:MAG: Rieske 2Fe-2S domain-containing protein [Candidatus Binatia bacterium]
MLEPKDAEALAAVGAGSPIGELLRRYWMPIAAVAELEEKPIRPVRVLGEDLVLYRDKSGTHGLVERWCQHRRFDLSFGMIEERGIRCSYHGWRYDETGRCLEQPFEDTVNPDSTFRDRIRMKSYPVRAKAGLLWTYLGPEPEPLLPDWAGFYSPGFTVAAFLHVPCNWVQIMEGFYDPVHIEWLHDRWSFSLNDLEVPKRRPRHTAFRWLDFEYGVVFQRKLEGSDRWLADRTVLFPNVDAAGGQGWYLTWIVPVDDLHTIMAYRLTITSWKGPLGQVMVPPKAAVEQQRIPAYRTHASLNAEAGPSGDFASHLVTQDYASWLGPGALFDRTREHLGETDRGIIMFRKKLRDQARLVAAGSDPQGVIRDPERNRKITLPGARKGYGLRGEGLPGLRGGEDVMLRAFLPFDLPGTIKHEIDAAMSELVKGLRPDWWKRRDAKPRY